jgi:alanine racemase
VSPGESVSYGATFLAKAERRVGTLAIGYADGWMRAFGNRASALVHGRCVPIVGVVTMDMTMIDVTDVPCEIGDSATLIGRDGDAVATVESVARTIELSPYELLTSMRRGRLEHVYVGASA